MSLPGTCDTGCSEHRLLLVRASTVDALASAGAAIRTDIERLRPLVGAIAEQADPLGDWEIGYEKLRVSARAALTDAVDGRLVSYVQEEPAEATVTWWCRRCHGIDAPQPCLGICIWSSVDWTRWEIYEQLRRRVVSDCDTDMRLRSLLRRVVHTSPRPGQHLRTRLAYGKEAECLLRCRVASGTVQARKLPTCGAVTTRPDSGENRLHEQCVTPILMGSAEGTIDGAFGGLNQQEGGTRNATQGI